jgi:transposase
LLVAHRRRLIQQRTRARNRLRSVLHQHTLVPPSGGGLFAAEQRAWWSAVDVSVTEQLRLRQELAILDHLEPLLSEVETELTRLRALEPWASQMPFLLQLPGMWIVTARMLLSASGDIARFPSPKQLVGSSGLGASVHASGKTQRTGTVTKQGRREVRTALVEAAWVAVERHPHWKEAFARLSARSGKGKAMVAIARRLLVVVWHTLSERSADRHGQTLPMAQKLMRWATYRQVATRQGLSRGAFVRRQLEQLGLGQELDRLPFKGKRVRLPPPEAPPALVGGEAERVPLRAGECRGTPVNRRPSVAFPSTAPTTRSGGPRGLGVRQGAVMAAPVRCCLLARTRQGEREGTRQCGVSFPLPLHPLAYPPR